MKDEETKNDGYDGWKIPSDTELKAFSGELGINKSNYSSVYGLNNNYFSSYIYTTSTPMRGPSGVYYITTTTREYISFSLQKMETTTSNPNYPIRLVKTY